MKISPQIKVALVHDDLVQWGGAERVLVILSEIFPNAPIYTSVYDNSNTLLVQNFASKKVRTSFIQKIPGWKSLYKVLLPLYPLAFEQFDFSEYDLVISQTTRFANSIITKPITKHVCYCHTPPRFLWNFSEEKVPKLLKPYLSLLRGYDHISSQRVDLWIAGSYNAQQRIKKTYRIDAKVVQPFVDLARFAGIETFDGGYLLVLCRLNPYKRVDLMIKAANSLGVPLKIVGTGPAEEDLKRIAGSTVEFISKLDENTLSLLIAGCKTLVVGGEEDFGLTPLEAQALGKPVIAYGKGGSLETVIEGQTGYFFEKQSVGSLISALEKLDKTGYNQNRCRSQAEKFSKENFIKQFSEIINSL